MSAKLPAPTVKTDYEVYEVYEGDCVECFRICKAVYVLSLIPQIDCFRAKRSYRLQAVRYTM